jgi:PPOX class probable F420-dependent enzyme
VLVEDAWARVSSARVARLATRNPTGTVDLVPITFAVVGERTIASAVDHKPKRTLQLQRLANIRSDPAVTLLVDRFDDDWTSLWWVRLRGDAVVIDAGGPAHAEAVAALVTKYEQYRNRPPQGPAVVIDVTEITGWAAVG